MPFRLCRFRIDSGNPRVGLVGDDGTTVRDLSEAGVERLDSLLERHDPADVVARIGADRAPLYSLRDVELLAPVDRQEIWAAGVTYLRSKVARMDESDFSATAYDRVYDAPRPEIFFKCLPEKVVAPGQSVGIRRDARWNVPEPELTLVFNSQGRRVGYAIGNDMSSRDIEGENLLYLPQAKIYDRSCSIGPWIVVGASEAEVRDWAIRLRIRRNEAETFAGDTSAAQIKRGFDELGEYLFRSQRFPHGAMLLTGTGVIPPDSFTLQAGDEVTIEISGIGRLENPVIAV